MPRERSEKLGAVLLVLCLCCSAAYGQQVTVTAPMHSVSDSFSERIGVSFGGSYNGIGFSFRGPQSGAGGSGLDPNAGGSINIPFRGGNFSGGLSIFAGQGSMRSLSTVAPIITLQNGVPGVVGSGLVVPFVTRLDPVVSAGPGVFQPRSMSIARSHLENGSGWLQSAHSGQAAVAFDAPPPRQRAAARISRPADDADRTDSSADTTAASNRADEFLSRIAEYTSAPSHAAATAANATSKEPSDQPPASASEFVRRGQKAEADGKRNVARIFYQMALRRADPELQRQVQQRLDALDKGD